MGKIKAIVGTVDEMPCPPGRLLGTALTSRIPGPGYGERLGTVVLAWAEQGYVWVMIDVPDDPEGKVDPMEFVRNIVGLKGTSG